MKIQFYSDLALDEFEHEAKARFPTIRLTFMRSDRVALVPVDDYIHHGGDLRLLLANVDAMISVYK